MPITVTERLLKTAQALPDGDPSFPLLSDALAEIVYLTRRVRELEQHVVDQQAAARINIRQAMNPPWPRKIPRPVTG